MLSDTTRTNIQVYRLGQIKKWLNKYRCDGLILFDPVNIRYATDTRNMQVWTMHNLSRYVFISPDAKVVVFELPSSLKLIDKQRFSDLRPALALDYNVVGERGSEMAQRWADEILSVLREAGGSGSRLAIDRSDLLITNACMNVGIELIDGKPIMERARSVKSVEEIGALTDSLRTCEESVAVMRENVTPGMRESEALGFMIKASIDRGGEYPETRLLTSGPRTNPWFQETSDRIIENGDLLAFDTDLIGPMGFYNDISRSWVVGDKKPNNEQRRAYAIAYQQLQHNIELLKPGMGFLEYSDKCYQLPQAYILNRYADVAHGCGLGVEYPFIWYREDEQWGAYDGVFEENMVVCVECYAGRSGGREGVKLEQPVWITADGPKALSVFPFEQGYL